MPIVVDRLAMLITIKILLWFIGIRLKKKKEKIFVRRTKLHRSRQCFHGGKRDKKRNLIFILASLWRFTDIESKRSNRLDRSKYKSTNDSIITGKRKITRKASAWNSNDVDDYKKFCETFSFPLFSLWAEQTLWLIFQMQISGIIHILRQDDTASSSWLGG